MLAKGQRRAKATLKDYVLLRIIEHLERGISLREGNSLCIIGYSSENAYICKRNY